MVEPIRIVITMDGGLITAVCSLSVPVQAVIIDYDTDGADQDELDDVPQGNGGSVEAYVRFEEAEVLHPTILKYAEKWWL